MSVHALQPTTSPKAKDAVIDLEKAPVDRVLAQLTVEPNRGLSSAEAQQTNH